MQIVKAFICSYSNDDAPPRYTGDPITASQVQLLLGFGSRAQVENADFYYKMKAAYPAADILLCSTAGQLYSDKVLDEDVAVCGISFDKTWIRTVSVNIREFRGDSREAGMELIHRLGMDQLPCHILLFSDGGRVNGSELVNGVNQVLGGRVPVTGGLAGDGVQFSSTCVGLNETPAEGNIVALAFYGDSLLVGYGSKGGWEVFGPSIAVTRSYGNRLYELNGAPALGLYKRYLGPYSGKLPGSALFFPLSMDSEGQTDPVVRTILSIDPGGCMVFAGDIPEGSQVRFMKANFDRLIDAASDAAFQALPAAGERLPALALLISCVGRRIVLDNRTDEEVEAVRDIYGKQALIAGFYSYGEISPSRLSGQVALHNQTMTITTFDEL